MMDYMFAPGFFGTKAPFFMDFVTLVVALLPLLAYSGVWFIRRGYYSFHIFYQILIFVFSIAVVGWFEYGVRTGGGFNSFIQGNPRPYYLLFGVLIVHIVISTTTMIYWAKTLWQAYSQFSKKNLPGGFTVRHIIRAKRVLWGVFLMALTGIWVYLLLFVY